MYNVLRAKRQHLKGTFPHLIMIKLQLSPNDVLVAIASPKMQIFTTFLIIKLSPLICSDLGLAPETKYDVSLTLYLAIPERNTHVFKEFKLCTKGNKLQRKGIVLFGIVYITFCSNTNYILQDPVIYNLKFVQYKTILNKCFTYFFDENL